MPYYNHINSIFDEMLEDITYIKLSYFTRLIPTEKLTTK